MNGEPAPFLGICGAKNGNGCGKQIQMRPHGTKEDGSTRWHPWDVQVEVLTGAVTGTSSCHFVTCPKRANFGGGKCKEHDPNRPPPHVHEYHDRTRFDLERGVKIQSKKCACGIELETGVDV